MKKKKETIKDAAVPATLDILDLTSFFAGVPILTATLGHFYQQSVQKRAKIAREILLSEIGEGNFANVDKDELLSVIVRYGRCAIEGAAKKNLRLLAKIIRGMVDKDDFSAPLFTKYSDVLFSLTEEEIHYLGHLCKVKIVDYQKTTGPIFPIMDESEAIYHSLCGAGLVYNAQQTDHLIKESSMIAKPSGSKSFGKNDIRTVLVIAYRITPMMEKIIEYTGSFSDEDLTE